MFNWLRRLFNRKRCCFCGSPIDGEGYVTRDTYGNKKQYCCSTCYYLRLNG